MVKQGFVKKIRVSRSASSRVTLGLLPSAELVACSKGEPLIEPQDQWAGSRTVTGDFLDSFSQVATLEALRTCLTFSLNVSNARLTTRSSG